MRSTNQSVTLTNRTGKHIDDAILRHQAKTAALVLADMVRDRRSVNSDATSAKYGVPLNDVLDALLEDSEFDRERAFAALCLAASAENSDRQVLIEFDTMGMGKGGRWVTVVRARPSIIDAEGGE